MPFLTLEDIPQTRDLVPGFHVRFVHTETMTFAWWEIAAGSALPEHSHHHEQICNVLEGEFELTIDGVTETLRSGTSAVIPGHAVHSGRALTDCRVQDVFCPVREDYRIPD